MKITHLLFFMLFISPLFAQSSSIKGKIIDKEGEPVVGAAVIVQTVDSLYINASTTDIEGIFEVKADINRYRLIIQHIMFEVKTLELSGFDAGTIILEEKMFELSEIAIIGERPIVKVVDGALTYDMERVTEGKAVSNAYESLLHLPGVSEENDVLTLAGASSVTVIINGKPSTMSMAQLVTLLKQMPASRIESAEVMYNAPPQYHVRGAAINLVLKREKNQTPVLQGEINGAYHKKTYDNFTSGVSLLYNTKRFSTDFLYGLTKVKNLTTIDMDSYHQLQDSIHTFYQYNKGIGDGVVHNARLGFDFDVNEKNKISLVYTTQIVPLYNHNEYSEGGFSISNNVMDQKNVLHNVGLDCNSGFGMKIGVNYTFYENSTDQNFESTINQNKNEFLSESAQNINRIMLYANQNHTLKKGYKLTYGTRFTFVNDHSFQKYTILNSNSINPFDTENTTDEYTANVFGGLSKIFSEKLSAQLSLSGEYYKRPDFDDFSFYPVCQVTYMPSYSHIFQFSFSSDKRFPGYWELQESISYLNGYVEVHGNTKLTPSTDYQAQLTYILKSKYVVSGYFRHSHENFHQLPYQSNERLALIYQTRNWDFVQNAGLNIVAPVKVKQILSSRLTLSGFYSRAKSSDFHDITFDIDKWVFYSRLDNTINISKKPNIKLEIMGFYITPSILGVYNMSSVWTVDAGIKWIFASEKAELRVKGTDIFDTRTPNLDIEYDTQNMKSVVYHDPRSISFSFSYKFGGYKEKERQAVDTSRFRQ